MPEPTQRRTTNGQVLFVLSDGRELGSLSELQDHLIGEAVEREALRCPECKYDCYANPHGERPCQYGRCVELFCRNCGHSNMGWGPVDCRCQRDQHRTRVHNRNITQLLRHRDRRARKRNR